MLSLEDLVDLGAALRHGGFRPSTQQTFAAQLLLLRLAADAALPPRRAELGSYFGPIYCTSALEQDNFAPLFRRWLAQRFPEDAASEPEPAPAPPAPPPAAWPGRWWLAGVAALVLGTAWYAWQAGDPAPAGAPAGAGTAASQPAAASAPDGGAASGGAAPLFDTGQARLAAQFGVADLLPPPTWFERLEWARVLLLALPGLLYALWQGIRLARRPVLQRLASRTPPRLREVFLPGGIRLLLPTLPLRRLAQELRRRRAVDSSELLVEPTIAATLRAGGVFSPVRGSRVEPEYLALIDRATLSDHQAQLCAELVSELARSDVLIERFDFNRDATVCRPRPALASGHASNAGHAVRPAASARATQSAHAVELTELHERHPEHRVLLFGDGAGCFDGYSGEPMPWLATLLLWATPVLLTPMPPARWGRREWALQRLGVQVLPLSRPGLLALVQFVAAGRGDGAGPAAAPTSALPLHERTPRRWLERDPPSPETLQALCDGLRDELGPRGWAWVAACAAYPEVHWGITLRLGAGLVGGPAEIEVLLPRLARLVWFREAYMPDWLREALIDRLGAADEARARELLRAMLEALAAGTAGDIPLRIAVGGPRADLPWWRRAWNALRARSLRARTRQLLRTAPEDSPLRDHVFLRFLSGQHTRRLDLRAPGALLQLLRAGPGAAPATALAAAAAATAGLAWVLPPVVNDLGQVGLTALQFSADGRAVGWVAERSQFWEPSLLDSYSGRQSTQVLVVADGRGAAWERPAQATRSGPVHAWPAANPATGQNVSIASGRVVIESPGQPRVDLAVDAGAVERGRFSRDGRRVALPLGERVGIWDTRSGQLVREVERSPNRTLPWTFSDSGALLATLQAPDQVRLWRLDTGAVSDLGRAPQAARGAWRLQFSPDSQRVAVMVDNAATRVWNTASGDELVQLPPLLVGTPVDTLSAPDFGTTAYIYRDNVVLRSVFQSGQAQSLPIAEASADRLAFSPDGALLASVDRTSAVQLWRTADASALGPPLETSSSTVVRPVPRLMFSPDARTLAAASSAGVQLWTIPLRGANAAPAPADPAPDPAPDPDPVPALDNPVRGLRFEIFVCDPAAASAPVTAARLQQVLRRQGAAEVRQIRINEDARRKTFAPPDPAHQLRYSRDQPREAAAARWLLADRGFRGNEAWTAVPVRQPSPGYISAVVCPPVPAPVAQAPSGVVSARQQLLDRTPALREKTLVLTGLRVRQGWIVDAVTPIFSELGDAGTLGAEHEGTRVGGGGGDEVLARRPGYVIAGFEVQHGIWDNVRAVLSLQVTWRRLDSTPAGATPRTLGPKAQAAEPPATVTLRFGEARGGAPSGAPRRLSVPAGTFVSDLTLADVVPSSGGLMLADLDVRDTLTPQTPRQGAVPNVPREAPPASGGAATVDGYQVSIVQMADNTGKVLGYLRRSARGGWVETGPTGQVVRFEFAETGRGATSVDLFDKSRNVRLVINLQTMRVQYALADEALRDQYAIAEAR